jgi:cytoskeletal protein CcmA (bactofilin family)
MTQAQLNTYPPEKVGIDKSPAPAAGEVRAYLDKGCRIMGKLFSEGPVRIDGQVDGEISANDVLIGEGAVVTAQLKAVSVVTQHTVENRIWNKMLAGCPERIRIP